MNPTKTQLKASLGFEHDTQLAEFLGITKQAVSQQGADTAIPDAWCWRGMKKRPDVFAPEAPKRARKCVGVSAHT